MSDNEPCFDFGDTPPSVKDGLQRPIKRSDAVVLQETMNGKAPKEALAAAGIKMAPSRATTYVEHIKNKYTDANGGLLVELENIGVDQRTLAATIKEGLSAERPTKKGQDFQMTPDHATRHKYVETVLDIQGARAPKHQIVENIQTHEQTVTFVDGIRKNPEVLLEIQRRLQERKKLREAVDVTDEGGDEQRD